MREASRSEWSTPFARLATKQTARKTPAAQCGVCFAVLLGIVGSATTFVARLASIRIGPCSAAAWDLFRGSSAQAATAKNDSTSSQRSTSAEITPRTQLPTQPAIA
jgi:hypothetical protein